MSGTFAPGADYSARRGHHLERPPRRRHPPRAGPLRPGPRRDVRPGGRPDRRRQADAAGPALARERACAIPSATCGCGTRPAGPRRRSSSSVMQTLDNYFHLRLRPGPGSSPSSGSWRPRRGHERTASRPGSRPATTSAAGWPGGSGGVAANVVTEVTVNAPITAHILGGCSFGPTPEEGVIDGRNRVQGYAGHGRLRRLPDPGEPGRQSGPVHHGLRRAGHVVRAAEAAGPHSRGRTDLGDRGPASREGPVPIESPAGQAHEAQGPVDGRDRPDDGAGAPDDRLRIGDRGRERPCPGRPLVPLTEKRLDVAQGELAGADRFARRRSEAAPRPVPRAASSPANSSGEPGRT
ncbi:MAG: hypothetical protein MZU79_04675 [Anaerotruncus sp.]|nr:hypothetical protein [Anaerotruncus sp.]